MQFSEEDGLVLFQAMYLGELFNLAVEQGQLCTPQIRCIPLIWNCLTVGTTLDNFQDRLRSSSVPALLINF